MHELRRSAATEAIVAGSYVRVAACNIWIDTHLREERYEAFAEIFETLRLDAVCVQEVPLEGAETHLARLTSGTGLNVSAHAVGTSSGNAVLLRSTSRAEEPIVVRQKLADGDTHTGAYPVATWERHGYRIRSCSIHLPWGGRNEMARLHSARCVDLEIERRPRCHIEHLAGDFNAEADMGSIAYLTGRQPYDNHTTQWTDAWRWSGEGKFATSSPENPYARIVGERHGFCDPRMLPERRIDYVFLRGYVHGQVGTPLRTFVHKEGRAGAGYPSDHWMVVSDLYLPLDGKTKRQAAE